MGIEKIGLNAVHIPRVRPKDETHKMIQRSNAVREDAYMHVKWSQENENQRLKAESFRISDINKINRQGMNAPAPNVHHYERPYKSNIPHYKQDVGTAYDILA